MRFWAGSVLLCLNSVSASFKGPCLCSLWRRVLQRDLFNQVSRCWMWRSSLWNISWLHQQMFYPYVTISAAQSDDLRHMMSPFSLFLSYFSSVQRILGYVRPWRIVAVHLPNRGKRRPHLWDSFGGGFELGQPSRGRVTSYSDLIVASEESRPWIETQHVCIFLSLHKRASSNHDWLGGECPKLLLHLPAHKWSESPAISPEGSWKSDQNKQR